MMNFESTQSIQKLIIDNEICGMTRRFVQGVAQRDDPIALPLLETLLDKKHLLTHPHTLQWLTEEHYLPSKVIDRENHEDWRQRGKHSIGQRATARAKELLKRYPGRTLATEIEAELLNIIKQDALRLEFTLPDLE